MTHNVYSAACSTAATRRPITGKGAAGLLHRLLGRRERGTTSLELAFVIPIVLLLFIGALDFGWYIMLWNMTSEAAREGARAGKVIVTPVATPNAVATLEPTPRAVVAAAAREKVVAYGGNSSYDIESRTGGNPTDGYYVEVVARTTWNPVSLSFFGANGRTVGAKSRLYLP